MYLICFLLFLFLATLLFCIVQNKSPYDQAIDDLAQETVLTQYCIVPIAILNIADSFCFRPCTAMW